MLTQGGLFCPLHSQLRSCVFGEGAWKKKNQNEQAFPVDLYSLGVWASPSTARRPQCPSVGGREVRGTGTWGPSQRGDAAVPSRPFCAAGSWDQQRLVLARVASCCQVRPETRSKAEVPLSCCWRAAVGRKLDSPSCCHLSWWDLTSGQPPCGGTVVGERVHTAPWSPEVGAGKGSCSNWGQNEWE